MGSQVGSGEDGHSVAAVLVADSGRVVGRHGSPSEMLYEPLFLGRVQHAFPELLGAVGAANLGTSADSSHLSNTGAAETWNTASGIPAFVVHVQFVPVRLLIEHS